MEALHSFYSQFASKYKMKILGAEYTPSDHKRKRRTRFDHLVEKTIEEEKADQQAEDEEETKSCLPSSVPREVIDALIKKRRESVFAYNANKIIRQSADGIYDRCAILIQQEHIESKGRGGEDLTVDGVVSSHPGPRLVIY